MSEDSKFSKVGKNHDSSKELHGNEPLIKHSINRKYGRKATEFPQSKNWIRIDWDQKLIPIDRINEMLIDAMKHKILGMNSIAMYLFTPESRRGVIIPPRQYRRITDYAQLRKPERNQAKQFWTRVKIYANRRQIPFPKREYGGIIYTEIDVLNYRINSVGNRLKKQTLKILGRGINFFDGTQAIHSIPTLDVAETVRPLLYFVVLRSLSLPMDSVMPIVDKIIADGTRWVMNRVELISGQEIDKFRINYHDYYRRITDEIREIELQNLGPHLKHKVTEIRETGVIYFITPTKKIKAGESIHRQLLSEFAQPLSLDKTKITNSDYLHIFSEVKIYNNNLVGRFDLMVVNNRLEVILLVDIKTHEKNSVELQDTHKSQVDSYLKILEDNGFIIENTIRSVIHVHREYTPNSIKPVIDWMMKERGLLLKELRSDDIRGIINYDTLKSPKKPRKHRFHQPPSLKKNSINIYDTQLVANESRHNLILSMWS